MRTLTASIWLLWLALTPAAAFDLSHWTRKALPNSPTVFYECSNPQACGEGSAISARLQQLGASPANIEDERGRQQSIAQRMRQQMADRVADVDVDQTRERPIEGLRAFVTYKVVVCHDGRRQAYVDGMLFGPTRAYSIVASGGNPEQVHRNFDGYARVIVLVLDQLAAVDRNQAAPPQQQPRPGRPPPQAQPALPQHQPPPGYYEPPSGPQTAPPP